MQDKRIPKDSIENSEAAAQNDQALLALMQDTIPQNKERELTEATVLEIGEKTVLLNTNFKADGVISLNEFKDIPNLKVGDQIEVYIETQEDRNGELVISRKKAKRLRGWQTVEDAYHQQKTLLGTVEGRVKGGLEVNINDVTVFLPGSQIDTNPVTDFDSLLHQSIEVVVLSIKPEKQNAVVSRRALLEHAQKALVENLKEGQVLEGIVRNITNFGVFVELAAGIVGLVYVKETVWDKKVTHPEQAKDAEGKPLFVTGETVKVVVKGFEPQEGSPLPRIALSTKALLPNPWDGLSEDLEPGANVTGHVTEIKERGICVSIQDGVEGFVHISEMSHSAYVQNPGDLVELNQELKLQIIRLDREEQDLRLGMKQLIPSPWDAPDFLEKYGLNTHHQAIVRKFADKNKGTFLEIIPGVEGYLDNDHISWTQKILRANDFFEVGQTYEIVILGVDDENRLLKLGMRELEDSPWDAFEENFSIGSEHEGVIKTKYRSGAIIELPYGLQAFVPNKELAKEDNSPLEEGETLKFRIVDFIKYEHKVMLSHTSTYKQPKAKGSGEKQVQHQHTASHSLKKTTLSDLGALSKLKEKLTTESKESNKKKEAKKSLEEETVKKEEAKAKKDKGVLEESKKEEAKKEEKVEKAKAAASKTTKEKASKEKEAAEGKEEEGKKTTIENK